MIDHRLIEMQTLLERIFYSFLEAQSRKESEKISLSAPTDIQSVANFLSVGEVEITIDKPLPLFIFETQILGLWAICLSNRLQWLEVGQLPSALLETQRSLPSIPRFSLKELGLSSGGLMNSPYLLVEISRLATEYVIEEKPQVIQLSLLPLSLKDKEFLKLTLGLGKTLIRVKGYGDCLIKNCQYKNIWWIEHFNSEGKSLLQAIEIDEVPAIVMAAKEDLDESLLRIKKLQQELSI
ncbi:hydrogenase expression/formation C-terminal domain-containing protein [Methylacidiphilum kamchatkense]|uniref:Hydrogenase-1 operon protein HyaF n=1 Tax=Methylacidiphilum kamchatkense Kam1 TaxID=1202785 RepID=A0A516TMT5_9BACT|nr:hydrogenase expression/formation C-terminal domain-containing protein [Methylacidiphilum kamchatkense]QDQ42556.1 hydrogenase-1 operon protein HyaF [Methylacidiphilum kamchatkense Kam1]